MHVGAGRAGVSSGVGPVGVYSSLGPRRRRGHGRGRAGGGAGRAQAQARSAAARAEKSQRIQGVRSDFQHLLTLHRQRFPPVTPPRAAPAQEPDAAALRRRFEHDALAGIGWFNRAARARARAEAAAAAEAETSRQTERARAEQAAAQRALDAGWRALLGNDPATVLATLAEAFADNEMPSAALDVSGEEAAVAVLIPPLTEAVPEQIPDTTKAGNPTLRRLGKRERNDFYVQVLCGHVLATVRETLAVAPGIDIGARGRAARRGPHRPRHPHAGLRARGPLHPPGTPARGVGERRCRAHRHRGRHRAPPAPRRTRPRRAGPRPDRRARPAGPARRRHLLRGGPVKVLAGLLTAAAVFALAACSAPPPAASATLTSPAGPGTVATVSALRVAPDGPAAGYTRAGFGVAEWPQGPDGCSVRDETLARQLGNLTKRGRCDVTAGTLADPYSGQTVTGPARSDQIDHVVPLALAWRDGAASWTAAQREVFATDPLELQTTTAAENDAKGDKGPEAWMPAMNPCQYAQRYVAIAEKYRLTVTPARAAALTAAC